MGRIVYFCLPNKGIAGGAKMIFRHVEALIELGHDAVVFTRTAADVPAWFESRAPVITDGDFRADDILVAPEDSPTLLRQMANAPQRKFIFCQNHFYSARGMAKLSATELAAYSGVMACSRTVADWVSWRFPTLSVQVVPAFADERRFRPAEKQDAIALIPRKRPTEAAYMRDVFRFTYARHAKMPWFWIEGAPEDETAGVMGRSRLFLSLSRLEGLGMAPLEAMAAGCLVAGFTGEGGREYATEDNGFWVDGDDPGGAVEALASAADLAATGGPALQRMLEAASETAARWSRTEFVKALEAQWRGYKG